MIAGEALRVDPLKSREDEVQSGTDPPEIGIASVVQEEFVFAETDDEDDENEIKNLLLIRKSTGIALAAG